MELGYTNGGLAQLDTELQCEALINDGMTFSEFMNLSIEIRIVSIG